MALHRPAPPLIQGHGVLRPDGGLRARQGRLRGLLRGDRGEQGVRPRQVPDQRGLGPGQAAAAGEGGGRTQDRGGLVELNAYFLQPAALQGKTSIKKKNDLLTSRREGMVVGWGGGAGFRHF